VKKFHELLMSILDMDEKHTYTIEFYDDRFDLKSELDEEGNQCYGKDVAEELSMALLNIGLDVEVFEEGYGWEVCGIENGKMYQIIVYPWGFLEGNEGKAENLWRLRLKMSGVVTKLYFFRKKVSVEFPHPLFLKIKEVVMNTFTEYVRDNKGEVW
jgi:hypothetical protein